MIHQAIVSFQQPGAVTAAHVEETKAKAAKFSCKAWLQDVGDGAVTYKVTGEQEDLARLLESWQIVVSTSPLPAYPLFHVAPALPLFVTPPYQKP